MGLWAPPLLRGVPNRPIDSSPLLLWSAPPPSTLVPGSKVRFDNGDCQVAVELWKQVGNTRQYQLDKNPSMIINSGRLVVAGAGVATLKSGPAEPPRPPRGADAKATEEASKKQRRYEIGATARGCALRAFT